MANILTRLKVPVRAPPVRSDRTVSSCHPGAVGSNPVAGDISLFCVRSFISISVRECFVLLLHQSMFVVDSSRFIQCYTPDGVTGI